MVFVLDQQHRSRHDTAQLEVQLSYEHTSDHSNTRLPMELTFEGLQEGGGGGGRIGMPQYGGQEVVSGICP